MYIFLIVEAQKNIFSDVTFSSNALSSRLAFFLFLYRGIRALEKPADLLGTVTTLLHGRTP